MENNNTAAPPGVSCAISAAAASSHGDVQNNDLDRTVMEVEVEEQDDWTSDDDYEEIDPRGRQPPEFEYNSEFQVCVSLIVIITRT